MAVVTGRRRHRNDAADTRELLITEAAKLFSLSDRIVLLRLGELVFDQLRVEFSEWDILDAFD